MPVTARDAPGRFRSVPPPVMVPPVHVPLPEFARVDDADSTFGDEPEMATFPLTVPVPDSVPYVQLTASKA